MNQLEAENALLLGKWKKHVPRFFDHLSEGDALKLAILLDNQRKFNEIGDRNPEFTSFRRNSIATVYRVFGPKFWLRNLVHFDAATRPATILDCGQECDTPNKNRNQVFSLIHPTRIEDERDYNEKFSAGIAAEIEREILNDLMRVAQNLGQNIAGVIEKMPHKPTWATCAPGAFREERAVHSNLNWYESEVVPKNVVLLGSITPNKGYYYMPYIPLIPHIVHEGEGLPLRVSSRIGKLLSKDGSSVYAKVVINES